MENSEVEKATASEDTSQLSRNRSFKSKQLVRSQAIRESTSPPRTVSPSVMIDTPDVSANVRETSDVRGDVREDRSDGNSENRQQVEIQITSGTWEDDSDQRQRTKRWLGNKQNSRDNSRDLLSNNPRIACVCGACNACPHCRGRRRKFLCPTKQDSGIVCSDDCPDCSDTESSGNNGGSNSDVVRKTGSLDEPTHYCRCPERKEKPKNLSLSRTDSDDRTDMSEAELVQFIQDTLNKNARDRMTLLKIEKELHALINDTGRILVKFPVMTSYGRMLVHRCAALFELNHNIDLNNKTCVLVSKSGTCGGRIPCTSFKQWCTATFPPSPQRHHNDTTHAKSILKRDTHSLDEPGAGPLSAARSKSLEQREREYERVRRRIFSSDNCNQEDPNQWQWLNSGPIKLLTPEGGSRNKLLKVQSLEGSGPNQRSTLSGRGPVSKSHSFGGYTETPPPRQISRQGDLASSSWRLSPSSSGYRTLSLHSTDSVTPSPTGGASPEPVQNTNTEGVAVMWAVTDFSAVPVGALVIHPQTGRPLTNSDGSLYHFDPANPPVIENGYPQVEQKIDINNDKKRQAGETTLFYRQR
ncbi:SUZ domain-containing protein [Phthorimaea operculella]|nr:SUZ domain-containing protein [Phthorimaea operculella]